MKHILALVVALLIALAPLAAAAEPIATDNANVSPPAPEITCFESLENQSSNVTPALYVSENRTNDSWKSDIRIGCDENGEYFSESGESVTVTDLGDLSFASTPGNDCDLKSKNLSAIDTCEEHMDAKLIELHEDVTPCSGTTATILHASAQPSTTRDIIVESEHPYVNDYEHTWEIFEPGAHQMRLHFDKLSLARVDVLRIYDGMGRQLVRYPSSTHPSYSNSDFWTEWQTTDTFLVELITDNQHTSYGFLIDQVEIRYDKSPPTAYRAESYHPYANYYMHTWEIFEPDAHQMRLHFDKLSLAREDVLRIYDEMGRQLVRYPSSTHPSYSNSDFWTEWQTTDTLLVELITDSSTTSYGFLIDTIECRNERFPQTEHFAESYHPYANDYVHTWEISVPGASKMRLHFDKLSLAKEDGLTIYDKTGKQLARYPSSTYLSYSNSNFWTEWQTTDTLRIKLSTGNSGTSYGFLIDLIETEDGVFTPSQLPPPTALTLHPGWNFVSVPRPLAEGNDTAAIFAGVETGGRSVLWYDTAAGRWSPFKETDLISLLEGFWIHSNETMTVPLDFSTDPLIPPAERRLSPGWNTVGVTGTIPATARDTFCSVKAQWTTLIGFNAGKQAFEAGIVNDGSGPNVDTRTVRPGKGYWLYMTEPGTLCAIGA